MAPDMMRCVIVIENDNHMKEMDSRDVFLFKIPEL